MKNNFGTLLFFFVPVYQIIVLDKATIPSINTQPKTVYRKTV